MGKKDKLSKKDRAKLERRAAELEAKIAAKAAKKAAKKAGETKPSKSKGKGGKPAKPEAALATKADRKGKGKPSVDGGEVSEKHTALFLAERAEAVLVDPDSTTEKREEARKQLNAAIAQMSDADLKVRVATKALTRKALDEQAETVNRDDELAVKRHNASAAHYGGKLLTSTAELAKRQAAVADDAPMPSADPKLAAALHDGTDKPAKPKGKGKVKAASKGLEPEEATTPEQVVEAVETERGTVYEAGTVVDPGNPTGVPSEDDDPADAFAKPSEAPHLDGPALEEGRNGYKIHPLKADGTPDLKKELQYTRVTSFIGVLEDKTNLEKWGKRKLLEGVVLAETDPDLENAVPLLADLIHTRDVALAKAAKADRKGKLAIGERAVIETAAHKAFKDAVDGIVVDLSELGGVHEKANKGTNLHSLAEEYDAEGMAPIDSKLEDGEISVTDHASIVAYGAALKVAGIKVLEAEVVVVEDGITVPPAEGAPKGTRTKYIGRSAGRLDRIVMAKLPGDARARRMVADIKSGSLDFGEGKLAQQLSKYAHSKGYDLETGERRDLKIDKRVGLVIHLPQGEGTCHIYPVDLVTGLRGNKLAAEVRAWRNDSKGAIDFSVDLAAPVVEASA
jgi:hypothetical protein